MEFTEASEFARRIQLREPEDSRAAESASHMGVEDGAAAAAAPQPSASAAPKQRKSSSKCVSSYQASPNVCMQILQPLAYVLGMFLHQQACISMLWITFAQFKDCDAQVAVGT